MTSPVIRRRLAFGSGVGIQIDGPRGEESLGLAAVRVRPSGARVRGTLEIADFAHQPAAEWGASYAAFLRQAGMPQAVATVLLPRQDVIVRQLSLPGVADKDLAAAVQFQMDDLHPYSDEDILTSWTRLPGSSTVLVSIARREAVERYSTLFAEAGVRVGCCTSSAAVVYSGRRLFGRAPAAPVLAYRPLAAGGFEMYGESPARPLLSAVFPGELERAAAQAASELRLESVPDPRPLEELLACEPPALPFAAALASACPRLSLKINLLPAGQRYAASPLRWAPSAALGALVLLAAGALAALPRISSGRYLDALQEQIRNVQPAATRSAELERQIAQANQRLRLLDEFRARARADMEVLAELTRLLPPPAWLNSLDLTARQVMIAGEIDQAAPLLKTLDASPLFAGSEFNLPPMRVAGPDGKLGGEAFRIRANREGVQP
jgi:Tfp pilus assembly protein PilN